MHDRKRAGEKRGKGEAVARLFLPMGNDDVGSGAVVGNHAGNGTRVRTQLPSLPLPFPSSRRSLRQRWPARLAPARAAVGAGVATGTRIVSRLPQTAARLDTGVVSGFPTLDS
ncbi:hypothetical protein HPB50_012619 [Hyalomma asiaticum]|uniref:Uncharacterized protein n=1 Tax=Hyalomma asiaticum TaxID=266040 RepID=A0ACB7S8U1_HYAAI|nr:hypothetical protein HPB50_012619 [Hyalomma asiaticum]